jgi:hypothetical protein
MYVIGVNVTVNEYVHKTPNTNDTLRYGPPSGKEGGGHRLATRTHNYFGSDFMQPTLIVQYIMIFTRNLKPSPRTSRGLGLG